MADQQTPQMPQVDAEKRGRSDFIADVPRSAGNPFRGWNGTVYESFSHRTWERGWCAAAREARKPKMSAEQQTASLANLDAAAQANLDPQGQRRYAEYKERLLAEGETTESLDQILRGFIWDELDLAAEDDDEA
jgi:type IV secretory pathway VirB4 component